MVVAHGEIWWLETPDDQGRPVLVVSRNEANLVMRRVMVTPATRTLRSAPSQLPLGRDEGLPVESVANFDDLASVPKALLVRRLGSLGLRSQELCERLRGMAGC